MKQEVIKRRILDNNISLAGNPTDCIRIREKKNDEGDINSKIIIKADVIQIIWPPLKNIPIRKLENVGNGAYKITSLVNTAADENNTNIFKLYFEHKADINVGDLIVRVFLDPDVNQPCVIAVKVTELLGDIGQMMLLSESCTCTIDVEGIKDETAKVIGEMARRRLAIGY